MGDAQILRFPTAESSGDGPGWAELHVHSSFSFLTGCSQPDQLVAEAARLGISVLAVTDRDGLYGARRLATAAAPAGIGTVCGAELTLSDPDLGTPVVIARTLEGFRLLSAAITAGQMAGAKNAPVSALEETLGVTLLERTTRKVLLSPAGERLAVRAKAVLAEVGALMEEAEAVRAPFTGVLRLGVIPTVAPYLLPTVLRLVHDRYRHLDLQVHEEQTASLVDGLAAGRLDLLLLAVPIGVPGVIELPLFDEDFVLVTPLDHRLGGRQGIPREALKELHLLLLDEGHCLRDQALDICREAGRGISRAGRSPSAGGGGGRREGAPVTTTAAGLSTLVQLVAGGLGCTLLPRTAVTVETSRSTQLLTASFADPAPTRRIALVMRAGAARGAEYEELAAALREALRPLPVRVLGGDDR